MVSLLVTIEPRVFKLKWKIQFQLLYVTASHLMTLSSETDHK